MRFNLLFLKHSVKLSARVQWRYYCCCRNFTLGAYKRGKLSWISKKDFLNKIVFFGKIKNVERVFSILFSCSISIEVDDIDRSLTGFFLKAKINSSIFSLNVSILPSILHFRFIRKINNANVHLIFSNKNILFKVFFQDFHLLFRKKLYWYMLLLYRILDVLRFKSVKSYVDIQYSEYAVVIPGALESYYLKSLIFRGFRFNCDLLPLIERTPYI